MQRRHLLSALGLAIAAPFLPAALTSARSTGTTPAAIRAMHTRWHGFRPQGTRFPEPTPPLERAAEAWRAELPEPAYRVLFEEDTERPFSSALNDEKRDGLYVCRACELPLFTSEMKYDSGTGWPSFFTAIPEHLDTKTDYKLIWPRTEYHCARCGGHQGHVFDDGPPPTGERWCNNGLALSFLPKEA